MSKICESCGEPVDGDATFCMNCGAKIGKKQAPTNSEIKDKAPLILAVLSIVIGIIEGLTAPMILGMDAILLSLLVVIIGGLIGIYLLMKKEEYLVSGIEFFAIAAVLFLFLGNMAVIGTIFFIITGASVLVLKGTAYSSKKLLSIPILTVVLVFVILVASGAFYFASSQDAIEIGNVTQDITYDYGYYSGDVQGDLYTDAAFDYLSVDIEFYDADGKVLESGIAWNDLNVQGGRTYHFSYSYFDENAPYSAQLIVYESAADETPLLTQNVTLY